MIRAPRGVALAVAVVVAGVLLSPIVSGDSEAAAKAAPGRLVADGTTSVEDGNLYKPFTLRVAKVCFGTEFHAGKCFAPGIQVVGEHLMERFFDGDSASLAPFADDLDAPLAGPPADGPEVEPVEFGERHPVSSEAAMRPGPVPATTHLTAGIQMRR